MNNRTPEQHKARVSAFRCQLCSKVSTDPSDFREIIGNVHIPDCGGLIGNNFRDERDIDRNKDSLGEPTFVFYERTPSSDYRQINVYSTIVCIPCFLNMAHIDGKTCSHSENRPSNHPQPEVI